MALDVALIVCGLVAIGVAIWGKRFSSADVEGMPYGKDVETSTWSGKLVFAIVGVGLLAIGMLQLVRRG